MSLFCLLLFVNLRSTLRKWAAYLEHSCTWTMMIQTNHVSICTGSCGLKMMSSDRCRTTWHSGKTKPLQDLHTNLSWSLAQSWIGASYAVSWILKAYFYLTFTSWMIRSVLKKHHFHVEQLYIIKTCFFFSWVMLHFTYGTKWTAQ